MPTIVQKGEKVRLSASKCLQSLDLIPPEAVLQLPVKGAGLNSKIILKKIKVLLNKCTFAKELKKKPPV